MFLIVLQFKTINVIKTTVLIRYCESRAFFYLGNDHRVIILLTKF
jgi:hypothetical protein